MKIDCPCGAGIVDNTDGLPHKGHLVPDQCWASLMALLKTLGEAGTDPARNTAAWKPVMDFFAADVRLIWQCPGCGRLFVDDPRHHVRSFVPADETKLIPVLRRRDV